MATSGMSTVWQLQRKSPSKSRATELPLDVLPLDSVAKATAQAPPLSLQLLSFIDLSWEGKQLARSNAQVLSIPTCANSTPPNFVARLLNLKLSVERKRPRIVAAGPSTEVCGHNSPYSKRAESVAFLHHSTRTDHRRGIEVIH